MRRLTLVSILTLMVSLVAVASAQAVVVNDGGPRYGVALVPGTGATLSAAGVSAVTSNAPCSDPWLPSDLFLPNTGLCWHTGGAVMHGNEVFDLTWDPVRRDWATTRNYIEQFLRDVADGSGTLTSPYAVTTQYKDPGGRAGNASTYAGGCVDFGNPGGSTCRFNDGSGTAPGNPYPPNDCPLTGMNQFHEELNGGFDSAPNDICLTDGDIQNELRTTVNQMGLIGRVRTGTTPVLVLMTPPGVAVCLDAAGKLCSANGASTARFCSYHSHLNVNGTEFAYVVQPWTASWTANNGCDEPDSPKILPPPPADQLAKDIGVRLASPLSQAHIASIVNPWLNGWFALDGSEINDNSVFGFGCVPFGNHLDQVTVGRSSQNPYLLQREFNNAGVIETDPNALSCTPNVQLAPAFVVPSAVQPGDVVELDGSKTVSTLIVPKDGYHWDFGDGSTAIGPSVVHTYSRGGDYNVTLTVTDRGGNTRTLSQTISVLGKSGLPVGGSPGTGGWLAHIQLIPQGLRKLLRAGVAMRVRSNRRADGFATLMIPRAAARRAHIRTGKKRFVVIGRGTVSGIRNGVKLLHVKVPPQMAKKLRRLHHVNLTIRLALVSAGREHLTLVAAGDY
jgi:PKD domain-containing protein